jgi:polysaccharide export outer membrane protein
MAAALAMPVAAPAPGLAGDAASLPKPADAERPAEPEEPVASLDPLGLADLSEPQPREPQEPERAAADAPRGEPTPDDPGPALPPAQDPILSEDAYILGPGDGLSLQFFDPQLSGQFSGAFRVLSDGTISLPLIGPAKISGLTLSQANAWLQMLYGRELLRPDLTLTVTQPRPIRVSLIGEVARPGLYTLTEAETARTEEALSISGLPTVVDAIQKAGGITQLADLRRVGLQRRLPGQTPGYKRARLNMLTLLREGDQLQNPFLMDGDVIRVARAEETVQEAIELSSTTLAPEEIRVNVVGEVKSPGAKQLEANTPLMQAVLAAGGIVEWRAKRSNVELIRINRNGTATRQAFRLDFSEGASNQANPPLRDGDTVIVNRSGYAVATDAIGAVAQPLNGLVNILTLYTTLERLGD